MGRAHNLQRERTTTNPAPRHASRVPQANGRSRALRLAILVIIRLLFPPIHQSRGLVDLKKMVVRFVTLDISGSVTDATHAAEILTKTLMIILAKIVTEVLGRNQGNTRIRVTLVMLAKSVSMHQRRWIVLTVVITVHQHTYRMLFKASAYNTPTTSSRHPAQRHAHPVPLARTAREA